MTRKIPFALTLAILLLFASLTPSMAEEQKTFIRMREVEIQGQIEHPEITYIIPKTRILFNPLPLQNDFRKETELILTPAGIEEEIRQRSLARKAGQP